MKSKEWSTSMKRKTFAIAFVVAVLLGAWAAGQKDVSDDKESGIYFDLDMCSRCGSSFANAYWHDDEYCETVIVRGNPKKYIDSRLSAIEARLDALEGVTPDVDNHGDQNADGEWDDALGNPVFKNMTRELVWDESGSHVVWTCILCESRFHMPTSARYHERFAHVESRTEGCPLAHVEATNEYGSGWNAALDAAIAECERIVDSPPALFVGRWRTHDEISDAIRKLRKER